MAKLVLTIDLDKVKKDLGEDDDIVYEVYQILKNTAQTIFNDNELTPFAFASPSNDSDDAPVVGSVILAGA